MDSQERILVVDDDDSINTLLCEVLADEGFGVKGCLSGKDALAELSRESYGLVLLDIMMPEMNGFEVCQRIREVSDMPVIFLTARNDETDTVLGFSLGADDYIVKPFKPRELVARVRARMRRARETHMPESDGVFDRGGLLIDSKRHFASLHDIELRLTPKEFDMLSLLSAHAGAPVAIKEIFESIWDESYNSFDSNTVMVHIRRIRKKIAQIDSSQEFITTIFGVGYKLDIGIQDVG